jgi:hypothetical protein
MEKEEIDNTCSYSVVCNENGIDNFVSTQLVYIVAYRGKLNTHTSQALALQVEAS